MMRLDASNPQVVLHPTGARILGLLAFMNKEINHSEGPPPTLENSPSITVEEAVQKLPQPIINEAFIADIQRELKSNQLKQDAESRLTHIVGKNYRDLWRIRKGMIVRAPDALILPESHDDCVKLMNAAVKHNVVIIPYGGGTNVVGAIEPSPFETRRMVVSVDMRRMSKMLAIDAESHTAVFECGVLGPDLDEQIGRHGFMFGHDPDSYIHSTLGGWIAARSSGAMSNTYGDIEDMVIGLKIVTPKGVVETPCVPRACGPNLNHLFIGSEGIFGIITEATVKIERIPKVKHYEGWLFPSFETGIAAFRRCTKDHISPTTMRLYDDDETRMSFALKTEAPMVQQLLSNAIKFYLQHGKGFQLEKLCLCIVGFEGTQEECNFVRGQTTRVFNAHNAFRVGTGAGNNWQEKKYDLPYVRDFALSYRFWADVFETCTVYSQTVQLHAAVKEAVRKVWKEEGKTGWIGCHAAHQYKVGCCLYFTYAGQQFDDNDMVTFLKIKRAATEAMLKHQGNLTHHHAIGYEHVPWMARYLGQGGLDVLLRMKNDLDPLDICNPWKVLPPARKSKETDQQWEERKSKQSMFDRMGLPAAKL